MRPDPLRVIATGGTFDKCYDPASGTLGFAATSHLERLLGQSRLEPAPVLETLMLIDSLEMTDEHRASIVAACRRASERSIVIVHGTDTLPQTARALAGASLPATVVLTGAMVPATIEGSDALFNLGFALACARCLPPGVYVCAHGRVFDWDDVRKNRSAARFESL